MLENLLSSFYLSLFKQITINWEQNHLREK